MEGRGGETSAIDKKMAWLFLWMSRYRQGPLGQWFAASFASVPVDEPVAAEFRARQLHAVLRLAPLTMLANALNAALIGAAFWNVADRALLVGWGLAVAGVVARGMRLWWRLRNRTARRKASQRALRRAVLHAGVLAGLWGLVPLLLLPGADGAHQLLVATITTGMMCAGGFVLATVPVAGTVYVLILGTSSAVALVRADFPLVWPVGMLLLVYAGIVIASVWLTARLFGARLAAETDARQQSEVIGLLLRDFEENTSDVLWEIDAEGRLCRVSPRLAALIGASVDELRATPVFDLLQRLAPVDESGAGALEAIRRHLQEGTPFRDLPLATLLRGTTRWWSLTAKPLIDADGRRVGWRGVAHDITEAQHANHQLTWLAHFDPLTGLANRHQFRVQLAALLAPAAGPPKPCAVLCLDLDHFKQINDTLGHAIGDGLLREVAKRLLDATRSSDTVARVGGDEFAIILRDVSAASEAEQLTQRLLEGLRAPCEVRGSHVAARASIGIAVAPRDGSDIDALLNHADLALYAAKSAGRGGFRLFAPQMAALTRRRLLIEQALRGALERGELSIVYQPQVDLAAWNVTGFEALLRWRHAELGEVSPGEFVAVAEEAGLIQAIGAWVLEEACREAAGWPQPLLVSVNVSPVQIRSLDLCSLAASVLRASGLAANRLELEITESVFMNEGDATMSALRSLREAGMRIALDDFGTGYSSLAYLRRFPFDTLKIDRNFVSELLLRRDMRAIVKMIVGLAQTLDMKIVAEGVDEPAQASVLSRYGCSTVQGYLIAEPMPADRIPAFLAAWANATRPGEVSAAATSSLPLASAQLTEA